MAAFKFKCRSCGKIELNPHCGDDFALVHLLNAMRGHASPQPQAPEMLSIHRCGNGKYGVSDLIGYQLDSQPAESQGDGQALHTTTPAQNAEADTSGVA
jgi:hypothetical protein